MERIEIKKLFDGADAYADQSVTVCGWVRTLRDSKAIGFIEINDGSCFKGVQIVFEAAKLANYKDIAKLNVGSAIKVTGKLILTPNANQPFEINADEISVEGFSTPDYPLQKKRHSLEYLRTIAHLRPRTNTFNAVFRIRSEAAYAIHKFFIDRGFVYAHTPLISCSDCEGAGEMFKVTTFDLANVPKNEDGSVKTHSGVRSLSKNRYAFSAEYAANDWTVRSEYIHSQGYGFTKSLTSGKETDCNVNYAAGDQADGFYALMIAPVISKKLYAKARYDLYRPRAEWGTSRTQYEIGANYWIGKSIMIGAEYARINDRSLAKPDYNMIDVEFDVKF